MRFYLKVPLFLLGASCTFIFMNWIKDNASVPKLIYPSSMILNGKHRDISTLNSSSTHYHSRLLSVSSSPRKKVILSWSTFFGVLLDDKYFNMCPELRQICEMSMDQNRYNEAAAIVFHPPDVDWSHLPPDRSQNQRYVFLLQEPPTRYQSKVDIKTNFYNWTMTYRMDSDIPHPYSHLAPDPKASQKLNETKIVNKTGGVVWFVSNCRAPSQREKYVEQLKRYISVDIYGLCGMKSCSKVEDPPGNSVVAPCEKDLIDGVYKFYIAFENSVCRDYITEKFFHRWHFNSVPIVLSRRIVQDYLPPKSFIAADDFVKGPKELAEYLKHLMQNHKEYLKYFEWKKIGYSPSKAHPVTGRQWGFCGLCEKLWLAEGRNESKVYKLINDWWGENMACDADFMRRLIG